MHRGSSAQCYVFGPPGSGSFPFPINVLSGLKKCLTPKCHGSPTLGSAYSDLLETGTVNTVKNLLQSYLVHTFGKTKVRFFILGLVFSMKLGQWSKKRKISSPLCSHPKKMKKKSMIGKSLMFSLGAFRNNKPGSSSGSITQI